MLREQLKWMLFPGLNLHARLRFKVLPRFFGSANGSGQRMVLDAGCGNGMLAYRSYQAGNRVLGISIKEGEIARNRKLFNEYLGISEERLRFKVHNLYDLSVLGMQFDEIICTEVLEHIRNDTDVCRSFHDALKPGGVLHLCCPNAEHPDHVRHHLDEHESGGHVRSGYTLSSYKALLEPIGFQIIGSLGLGGPARQVANKQITAAQEKLGLAAGMLLFMVTMPMASLGGADPKMPYSLYVRAQRSDKL